MQKTFDIIGKFKFAILLPIVVIITGIFFNVFVGADLAIDFRGGTEIIYSYEGELDLNKVKQTAETALVEVNSETVLSYSYTNTIDTDAVVTTLNSESFEGIKFSADTSVVDNVNYIEISAVGNEFLTEKQVDAVSKSLTTNYATNSLVLKTKTQNTYNNVTLEVASSASLSNGGESIKVNVVGNIALNTTQFENILEKLNETFPDNNIKEADIRAVSQTFGASFFGKAIWAIVLASALVIVYVGFRFKKVGGIKAGLTALAALIHDVFFVYFVNVIFGISIDINFIAVFLTILGYSLNDTIVIYDRIRENSALYGNKMSIREITNLSITQSFKRTCVTSLTTFSAIMTVTVVAAVYGLESILTFSIPMSVGTLCGTFSSLFIAGPLYVFWCEHSEKKSGNKDGENKTKKSAKYANKINPKKSKKRVY